MRHFLMRVVFPFLMRVVFPFLMRVVFPFALVAVLAAAVFYKLYRSVDGGKQMEFKIEIGKAMLQVITVVLVGTIVAMIVKDFEERRKAWLTKEEEQRKASLAKRDLLRADLTDGLMTLYSQAKRARRLLRANVRVENASIETKKYDELIQEISDAQLGLERYKLRTRWTDSLPKSVFSDLDSMEKYLGKLVTEYEDVLPLSRKGPTADANIPLANLPNLSDFIGGKGSDFHSKFVKPYHDAARVVDAEIEKDLAL